MAESIVSRALYHCHNRGALTGVERESSFRDVSRGLVDLEPYETRSGIVRIMHEYKYIPASITSVLGDISSSFAQVDTEWTG